MVPLVPFNQELNRLTLVVKHAPTTGCKITWGATSRIYTTDELARLMAGPPLAIARSGTNVILTWSTAYSGYTLQSSTQLVAGAAWSSVSPQPVVLNNLNTVTNPVSTKTKFYRLSQ